MRDLTYVAPRAYSLGRRAEAAKATRRRILDATIELYQERGFAATTIKAVAERADVARGTVLHHFGDADGLLGAVLDEVLDQLQLPDARVLEGVDDPDERIRVFVRSILEFMERSNPWWTVFERHMDRPETQQREALYWEALGRFQAAALGPRLAADPVANGTILSLTHPATVGTFVWSFERVGRGRDEAWAVVTDLAVDALHRRSEQLVEAR